MKKNDVDKLDKQITDKVVPFCRDKEIPFLATTPGNTYIMGTQSDLAQSLENIFKGLIIKDVFEVHEILSILAMAQTKIEEGGK